MSARQPPRLAVWLVEHMAPSYQREALAGDLLEEYLRRRSRRWYWKQVGAVLVYAGARRLRAALPKPVIRVLRLGIRRLAAIMAVTALGVGTLTWAATAYTPSCSAQVSSCHKSR
jgi:hypothetical protein